MEQINLSRLKKLMKRAEAGEELTIGFLGGSITQGSLASDHRNTYAYRVFDWWKKTFPKAEFHYVNGGIGGTTSQFGVARAVTDVLMYQPDFVAVDFSVNDEPDDFFMETYEGTIRKLLSWDSKPAVVILNNVYYDSGKTAQKQHNTIGDWYHVPHVSIKETVYAKMKEGVYTMKELSPDGLHPNDKGHGLVADEIIKLLENVKVHMDEAELEPDFPEPLTQNAYENAMRLTIREISPELNGFKADSEEKNGHLDFFKNGWIGRKAKDRITFNVEASCIAIQYKKTIKRPAVKALLILDDDTDNKIVMDGNFDEDWGDCLYIETILNHGERKKHKVEIVIPDTESENDTPFYLMSLIIA